MGPSYMGISGCFSGRAEATSGFYRDFTCPSFERLTQGGSTLTDMLAYMGNMYYCSSEPERSRRIEVPHLGDHSRDNGLQYRYKV